MRIMTLSKYMHKLSYDIFPWVISTSGGLFICPYPITFESLPAMPGPPFSGDCPHDIHWALSLWNEGQIKNKEANGLSTSWTCLQYCNQNNILQTMFLRYCLWHTMICILIQISCWIYNAICATGMMMYAMEMISALMSFVLGNHRSPVDSPHKESVIWSFDILYGVRPINLLGTQSNCRSFDTSWRSCDV